MTAPVFVDTNVLVYRQDGSDPTKQSRADDWIAHLARLRAARISFQVLQELYATLTRKLKPAFDAEEAQGIVRDLRYGGRWSSISRSWNEAGCCSGDILFRGGMRS